MSLLVGSRRALLGGGATRVLTSDSFNRADTSAGTLGTSDAAYGGSAAAWTTSGEFKITSNKAGRSTATNVRTAFVPVGQDSMRVTAVLNTRPAGGFTGILARFTDTSNYYVIFVDSTGAMEIDKRVAGVTSRISGPTTTGVFTGGDTLGISVIGTTVTAYVNGVSLLSVNDTSITTGSNAGLYVPNGDATITFDDFKVFSQ